MRCIVFVSGVPYSTHEFGLIETGEGTGLCDFYGAELGYTSWEEVPEFGRPLLLSEVSYWNPELWAAFLVWRIKFKLFECGEVRALGLLEPVFAGGA